MNELDVGTFQQTGVERSSTGKSFWVFDVAQLGWTVLSDT